MSALRHVLFLATFLCCSAFADIAFYDPINLSYTSGHSFAPSIDVNSQGVVYVAWHDNEPGNQDIFFIKSEDKGASYQDKKNISNNLGNSSFVDLTVGADDSIYLAWADNTPQKSDIFVSYSTNVGANFQTPVNITTSNVDSTSVKIGVDSTNTIFLVWSEDGAIHVASKNPQGAVSKLGHLANGSSPRIAIDGDDIIHIVYASRGSSDSKQVFYSRSVDRGLTFSEPESVSFGTNIPNAPALDVSESGDVYVTWSSVPSGQSKTDIYYCYSHDQGSSFTSPLNLTNNTGVGVFSDVYVDVNNTVHVTWNDTTPGNYETMYSVSSDGGASFTIPLNITPSELGSLKAQVAVDGDGYVHIASDDNRYEGVFEAVVATGKNGVPSFSNLTLSTQVLSPNGDGEDDTVHITAEASEVLLWTAEIVRNDDGLVVYSRNDIGIFVDFNWTGLDRRGNPINDGTYTVVLSGRNSQQINAVAVSADLSVNTTSAQAPPEVVHYENMTAISPNDDGRQEEAFFEFEFNKKVSWTLKVLSSSNDAVFNTSGESTIGSATWNGRDTNGNVVADDKYEIQLTCIDSGGQEVVYLDDILVDTVAPQYSNLNVGPNPFTPNGDGIDDTATISVDVSEGSLVTVYILQSDNVGLVKELDRTFYTKDQTVTLEWGGLTDGGLWWGQGSIHFQSGLEIMPRIE